MSKFSKNLKEMRTAAHMERRDIAKELNMTAIAYGKYERGEREPKIDTLIKIADIFHTSIDKLVGRKSDGLSDYDYYRELVYDIYESKIQERDDGIVVLLVEDFDKDGNVIGHVPVEFANRDIFTNIMLAVDDAVLDHNSKALFDSFLDKTIDSMEDYQACLSFAKEIATLRSLNGNGEMSHQQVLMDAYKRFKNRFTKYIPED